MSTESQEAKQAARWHYKPVSLVGSPKATRFTVYDESGEPIVSVYTRSDAEAICNSHNTATAKARELLEETRRERDCANENYYHIQIDHDKLLDEAAKLREEASDLIRRLLQEDVPPHEKYGTRLDARHWLAHQPLDSARDKQPSMIRRNPNEDHRAAQQPSAPTADVPPQGQETTCSICGGVDDKHVPGCSSLAVTVEISEQPSAEELKQISDSAQRTNEQRKQLEKDVRDKWFPPSAPTADCKALPGYKGCATHHWFGSECPYSKRLPQYALPDAFFVYLGETPLAGPMTESAASESAKAITVAFTQRPPTADVEKIARKIQAVPPTRDNLQLEQIRKYLAQARAPLVETLEQLRAYCGVTGNMLIDAALTGTGGKK